MNFAVISLGCKVNRTEVEDYIAALEGWGHVLVPLTGADIVIINTCTVTGEAERKTRKAVNHALAAPLASRIILTGCSTAISPVVYQEMDPRICVVPKAEMPGFLEQEFFASGDGCGCLTGLRSRSGICIQDGCDNACTYCIVHVARGASRSFPREDILAKARACLEAGNRELVLNGINLGTYRDNRGGLTELVAELLEVIRDEGGGARIRLSSIEPTNIDASLLELMAASQGSVCRHLHVPLQSGSTRVLAEMNRPYTAEEFKSKVSEMRGLMPGISLSTDIIVGFPGETEEDFEETLEVARFARFAKIHVFPYSVREGTPAAVRKDQVPPDVKAARAKILRDLSDELRRADYDSRVGKAEGVIAEGNGFGTTESYHRVPLPASVPAGTLISVTLPPMDKGGYHECFD